MWKNIAERGRAQMTIWCVRIVCWISKTTNTHSECVICFSTTTMVARTYLNITLYVHCLSYYFCSQTHLYICSTCYYCCQIACIWLWNLRYMKPLLKFIYALCYFSGSPYVSLNPWKYYCLYIYYPLKNKIKLHLRHFKLRRCVLRHFRFEVCLALKNGSDRLPRNFGN
jgi:hypothetical protein